MSIALSDDERAELLRRAKSWDRRAAERARTILACADGMSNADTAKLVGVQDKTVRKRRGTFAAEGLAGLKDADRIGRPKADLVLSAAQRDQLQRWARRAKTAQYLALRARIVLRCAEGGTHRHAAMDLASASRPWNAGGRGSWTSDRTACRTSRVRAAGSRFALRTVSESAAEFVQHVDDRVWFTAEVMREQGWRAGLLHRAVSAVFKAPTHFGMPGRPGAVASAVERLSLLDRSDAPEVLADLAAVEGSLLKAPDQLGTDALCWISHQSLLGQGAQ